MTVTDFSSVALQHAHAAAADADLLDLMEFRIADARTLTVEQMRSWPPVLAAADDPLFTARHTSHPTWDLVSCHYLHLPLSEMHRLIRELVHVVEPGGTLLLVGHHPDDLAAGLRRPDADLLTTAEQLAAAMPATGWDVYAANLTRTVSDQGGNPTTATDAVLVAVRAS